jgi:hypothetical protein
MMTIEIMLDAAFPPSPAQWAIDLDSVHANVGAIYTFGGLLHYTSDHVRAAQVLGKRILPIVVPGDTPPAPDTVLDSIAPYGITSGPVGVDRENMSMYPVSWDDAFDARARARGFVPLEYHNRNDARTPPDVDEQWLAAWIRTGAMDPVPSMPAGFMAYQFVNDVRIGGSLYDVSIVDTALWEGAAAGADNNTTVGGIMTEAEAIVWHHVIQDELFGFIDSSGQASFVDAVLSGVPINAIWDGWNALPARQAWSDAKARLLQGASSTPIDTSTLVTDLQKVVDDLKTLHAG